MATENFKDEIEDDLPDSFYKYYSLDNGSKCENCSECKEYKESRDMRNRDRVNGEVYFSTPLDFNDLIDSRLKVENNAQQLKGKALISKLLELYIDEEDEITEEEARVKGQQLKSVSCPKKLLLDVHKKQVNKIGILCFTESNLDANMWGYYANNNGFCIEYDTTNLVYDIVLNFAATMSPKMTELLIGKGYKKEDRDKSSKPKRTEFARNIFSDSEAIKIALIKNKVLSILSDDEQKFFVQNLYVKRLWGRKVTYLEREEISNTNPTLFEDKTDKKVTGKYFVKEKFWEHEKEYRFILSLGGRKAINLRPETIKSITFGGNTIDEDISKIKESIPKGVKITQIDIGEKNNLITKEI